MITFPESSFFKERRASTLPTTVEIRAVNKDSGDPYTTNFNRPLPVKIPSLGLVVKYGADVTVTEAQTQMEIREQLQGHVPTPEIFGWSEDGGQVFVFMSLVEGETLEERWSSMNEVERQAICKKLQHIVKIWRALTQDQQDCYIGTCIPSGSLYK
jgi:hypothetical protein